MPNFYMNVLSRQSVSEFSLKIVLRNFIQIFPWKEYSEICVAQANQKILNQGYV